MPRSNKNPQNPIGRRSFLTGTGLTALTLPQLLAEAGLLAAAEPVTPRNAPVANGATPATPAAAAPLPEKPLVPWMYMIYPLEQWLDDYEQTLDAWAEGGVRGLVIGPLVFYKEVPRFDFTYSRPGERLATFAPEPAIYRKYGVEPPAEAPRDPKKEQRLHALIKNAAARGWEILFFGPGQRGRAKSFEQDPSARSRSPPELKTPSAPFPKPRESSSTARGNTTTSSPFTTAESCSSCAITSGGCSGISARMSADWKKGSPI